MESHGGYEKWSMLGSELRHNDEIRGWEWTTGRWDPQLGRAVLIDEDTGSALTDPYVETDHDPLPIEDGCTYIVFRPDLLSSR